LPRWLTMRFCSGSLLPALFCESANRNDRMRTEGIKNGVDRIHRQGSTLRVQAHRQQDDDEETLKDLVKIALLEHCENDTPGM
jgi:hypothetical protein